MIRVIQRGLPVQPLLDAILPDMWEDITVRQRYPGSAHRDTECIFLRGPANFLNFFDTTAQDYPHLPQLIEHVLPVVQPLLDALQIPGNALGRLMLVKLSAHGHVSEHTDQGAYADAFSRHHVILSTNDHCSYHCGDVALSNSRPGDAFWFDHHKPHHAHNYGDTDRVHLIIDTLAGASPINWSDLCPKI